RSWSPVRHGCERLAALRPAWINLFTRSWIARARVHLVQCGDLWRGQTIRSVFAAAPQRNRFKAARTGIVNHAINDAIILVARRANPLGDHRQLRGRDDLGSAIGVMIREVLPQVRGVQANAVVPRRSSDHPIKVVWIPLHLGVALMAASRTPVVVRALQHV